MGGVVNKQKEINKFSPLKMECPISGVTAFDKIFLLADKTIEDGERIRFSVVAARETLARITKTHRYKETTLADMFKVWCWAVGALNDGKLAHLKFKMDWDNYVYYEIGNCADYRLEYFPYILAIYIEGVDLAKRKFEAVLDRLKFLMEKLRDMKEDQEKFKALLQGVELMKKAEIAIKLGVNIAQLDRAIKIAELFSKSIDQQHAEVSQLIDNYQQLYLEQEPNALKVHQDIGYVPYLNDPNQRILKRKMQEVAARLGYKPDPEILKQETVYKAERKERRPKIKEGDKWSDIYGPETEFPWRFRWLDSKYLDTHYSSMSVALQELESARAKGDLARKQMIRLTATNKCKEKTVTQALEIWTWAASSAKGNKLKEMELKLLEDEPWLGAKVELKDVKFEPPAEAEKFRAELLVWLEFYSPPRYLRMRTYWEDFVSRSNLIREERFKVFQHFADLSPPDIYNAITSLHKNMHAGAVYQARGLPLYNDIICKNGIQGLELYQRAPELFQNADELGAQAKGVALDKLVEKLAPGRLATEEDIKARKAKAEEARKVRKEKKFLGLF